MSDPEPLRHSRDRLDWGPSPMGAALRTYWLLKLLQMDYLAGSPIYAIVEPGKVASQYQPKPSTGK